MDATSSSDAAPNSFSPVASPPAPSASAGRLRRLLFGKSFRLVEVVAVVLVVAIATISYSSWRLRETEANRGNPVFLDPYDLAEHRDHNYAFTVKNNTFTYKGITGNYIDEHVLVYGAYEKYMLYFMRDYIKATGQKDSAMIDVGADVGQHSLFMSRHVQTVHSFEPYPPVLARFKEMIRLNGFDNITIHEVGLGDKEGTIPFYAPLDTNLGAGTFRKEAADVFRKDAADANKQGKVLTNLRVVVGDEWLESVKMPPVSLIKIDVEGFEEPVLKGLKQTLEKQRPLVIVEISQPPVGTIINTEQLHALFPENYRFLYLARRGDLMLNGKYELRELLPDPTRFLKTTRQVDVVAYPEEKSSQVPRRKTEDEPRQP